MSYHILLTNRKKYEFSPHHLFNYQIVKFLVLKNPLNM